MPSVKQIETTIGENYAFAVIAGFGGDYLEILKDFELPEHRQSVP
jgi:hypothetical protein